MKQIHYGWLMALLAACTLFTFSFQIYTFGVFFKPLELEFGWERGALSGAFSVSMLIAGLLAILTGRLSDKYGPRMLVTLGGILIGVGFILMSRVSLLWHVYLLEGVVMGIGCSACFVPVMSTVPRWFAKKSVLAVAIGYIGFGLGGVVSPPLAQWLISAFGWRQAFIILGAIITITIVIVAQFMKHSPQRVGLKPYGYEGATEDKQTPDLATADFSFKQAIKSGRFWTFSPILFCFFFSLMVVLVHIVPYAIDTGMAKEAAASILSIIAAVSLIGRLSMGFISDKIGSRMVLIACTILTVLAMIWLLFVNEAWMFYVFAVLFGLAYGGIVPLETVLPAELFGFSSLGVILACVTLLGIFGASVGPFAAGNIFDVTGNYTLAFLTCVILGSIAIILSLILLRVKLARRQG